MYDKHMMLVHNIVIIIYINQCYSVSEHVLWKILPRSTMRSATRQSMVALWIIRIRKLLSKSSFPWLGIIYEQSYMRDIITISE